MIALLAASLQAALAGGPSEALLARATGRFVPDESASVLQARLDAAIERTLAGMSWMFRPVARPRMRDNIHWCRSYRLKLDTETLSVACDAQAPSVWALGRTGVVRDDEGDPMSVNLVLEPLGVGVVLSSDKAVHTTRFRFGEAGRLDVSLGIESPYMSVPLTWRGRYRRDEQAPRK